MSCVNTATFGDGDEESHKASKESFTNFLFKEDRGQVNQVKGMLKEIWKISVEVYGKPTMTQEWMDK
jgi:hypothetical protein